MGSPSTRTWLFGQVPAARAHQQRGGLLVETVDAAVRVVEGDRALDRVDQVDLALDHVLPGRRVGVLEVGHVHVRARVERVDEHLALGRAGQLDPALLEVGVGDGRDPPVAGADVARFGREVRQLARVQAGLAFVACLQQRLPPRVEFAVQARYELESRPGQHVVEARQAGTTDLDAGGGGNRHLLMVSSPGDPIRARRRRRSSRVYGPTMSRWPRPMTSTVSSGRCSRGEAHQVARVAAVRLEQLPVHRH